MNKSDLHVGQRIYLQPVGNNARYSKELKVGVIKSIGSKYFTIEGYWRDKFIINTMTHECNNFIPSWKVWISLDDYNKHVLISNYSSKLGLLNSYDFAKLGIEKLTEIINIMGV